MKLSSSICSDEKPNCTSCSRVRLQTDDVGTGSIEPRSLFVSPVLVVDILRNLNSNLELETRTENFPLKPGIRSSKNENKRRAEKQVNKKRDFTRITSAGESVKKRWQKSESLRVRIWTSRFSSEFRGQKRSERWPALERIWSRKRRRRMRTGRRTSARARTEVRSQPGTSLRLFRWRAIRRRDRAWTTTPKPSAYLGVRKKVKKVK